MATYDGDDYRSYYTAPVYTYNDERALIIGRVSGLSDAASAQATACATALAARGTTYPYAATGLPLRNIRAQMTGPNTAIVYLSYYRVPTSSTGVNPFTYARVSGGIDSELHWKYKGPSGSVNSTVYSNWQSYYVPVPVWTIQVPTILASSPIPSCGTIVGSVNGDSITYSGGTFSPNVVLFNHLDLIGRVVSGTVEFDVNYNFIAKYKKWIQYDWDSSGAGTVETTAIIYGTTVFANQFPYTT